MKHIKPTLCVLLVLALFLVPLAGCSGQAAETAETGETDGGSETSGSSDGTFSYSDGIDENGFWEGVTALDHVELFDYKAMNIPSDAYEVSDEEVQDEIDNIVSYYTTEEEITDRAVEDGDTVNIDYVGSVDGVEFEGGNTDGAGTDITIGETSYIDDFLEQLIGHKPGETFDIEVTFPEDYGQEELNGKDAVFVTTINYIVEAVESELNDAFVAENLNADYGWSTVDEMTESIRTDLRDEAIQSYIQTYLSTEVPVENLPEEMVEYQQNSLVSYYEEMAEMYGVEIEEFLTTYVGVSSMEELQESEYDYNVETATYFLVIQAIAEDAGMEASDEDVADYFAENMGSDDYSEYETEYGMPYLKQVALSQKVLDYLVDNAVLA